MIVQGDNNLPEQEPTKRGSSQAIRIAVFIFLAVLALGVILMLLYLATQIFIVDNDEDSGQSQNYTNAAGDLSRYEAIQGFEFKNRSKSEDPVFTYEHIETGYTVSMVVSESLTDIVDEEYNQEPKNERIEGTTVSYIFKGMKDDNGLAQQSYSDIAYSFEANGIYHSGNISNPEGEPARDELLNILNEFVSGVVVTAEAGPGVN